VNIEPTWALKPTDEGSIIGSTRQRRYREPRHAPCSDGDLCGLAVASPLLSRRNCRAAGCLARRVRVRLALGTLRDELGVEPNGRSWHVSGATCSWRSPGFELVEGLGVDAFLSSDGDLCGLAVAWPLLGRRPAAGRQEAAWLDGLEHEPAGGVSQDLALSGAACSWLGPGLEFVEGLGGLGKGVGDGLVPVHVGAAGAEFSRAPLAQSFRDDQADQLSEIG
jgi:hypothetical protein